MRCPSCYILRHAKILPQIINSKIFICVFLPVGMLLKYESHSDYVLMPIFPKIFHFKNKASNKPGCKEVISTENDHSRMVY